MAYAEDVFGPRLGGAGKIGGPIKKAFGPPLPPGRVVKPSDLEGHGWQRPLHSDHVLWPLLNRGLVSILSSHLLIPYSRLCSGLPEKGLDTTCLLLTWGWGSTLTSLPPTSTLSPHTNRSSQGLSGFWRSNLQKWNLNSRPSLTLAICLPWSFLDSTQCGPTFFSQVFIASSGMAQNFLGRLNLQNDEPKKLVALMLSLSLFFFYSMRLPRMCAMKRAARLFHSKLRKCLILPNGRHLSGLFFVALVSFTPLGLFN